MTRPCASPGCATLTFGEICLGCLQRAVKDQLTWNPVETDPTAPDPGASAAAAGASVSARSLSP
jgi:hypothetical protein